MDLVRAWTNRFAALPGARVGAPSAGSGDAEIGDLLTRYPALARDPSYIAFLRTYSAADLVSPDGRVIVVVSGISTTIGMHVADTESPVVDDDGWFCVATIQMRVVERPSGVHDYAEIAFTVDATGEREPGVYGHVDGGARTPHSPSFIKWLELVVERQGRLLDI
jgi:hypothetical protein